MAHSFCDDGDSVMTELSDDDHLRRAIRLAVDARAEGNPPFGSLLVSRDGVVIREERNTTVTDADVTAHPELKLARWAARELSTHESASTTMYTSCQPCPMCANAIARAGLGRVVYALSTEQLQQLKPPGFVNPDSTKVLVVGPRLLDEARAAVGDYYG